MVSKLKELVKAAKTRQDALEIIHIELQNLKIQLLGKNYKVKTSEGPPGPDFDEDLEENQYIEPKDKELVVYYKTVRKIIEAVDDYVHHKAMYSPNAVEQEFIQLLEQKPH
ncbi:MAG TPA: hypothetical protein VD908_08100 [Cytophagales bacterium]|nr:hypothetical protein [Cytophagales bacterium]